MCRALRRVDNNILKLDSAFDQTVALINRPKQASYRVERIVEQMKQFEGQMVLQTMFLRGVFDQTALDNTSEEELSAWLKLVAEIRPREVMVYSLDRDTPCQSLEKVPRAELDLIAEQVRALGIACVAVG